MAKHNSGRFVVTEIENGRWLAAATSAPYFCFRAASEEAVVAKVKAAVTYCQSLTVKNPSVKIAAVSQTLTSIRDGKHYDLNAMLEAA